MKLRLIKNHERVSGTAPKIIELTGPNIEFAKSLIADGFAELIQEDAKQANNSTSKRTTDAKRTKTVSKDRK